MKSNFERSLSVVLRFEGGWSNHPSDPGGATMKGVTQEVYDRWRAKRGEPKQSVRNITELEVREIYRVQYWRLICGDDLPAGVDLAVFDFAVNSGPSRAVQELQRCLGLRVDGDPGSVTLEAALSADAESLIAELCARRLAFMRRLSTWSVFGRGWERRVREVQLAAARMVDDGNAGRIVGFAGLDGLAGGDAGEFGQADTLAAGRATPEAVRILSTTEGQGIGIAGVGIGGVEGIDRVSRLLERFEWMAKGSEVLSWVFTGLVVFGVVYAAWGLLRSIREGRLG